ncbi:MAG: hypothetical protein V2B15_15320 [Bacteroidota bacterium]
MKFNPCFLLPLVMMISCQDSSTGNKRSAEVKTSGTVQLDPGNPRYLRYRGEPVVLITSGEHYGGVLNLDFDYKVYLETLGSEGFNYTRIFAGCYIEPVNNLFGIERNTLAPLPGRYIAPWVMEDGKYNLDKFNPAFFMRLKDFVLEAENQGVVVEVTLFTSIYAEGMWSLCPFHADNNVNGVGEMDFHHVNTLYNGDLRKYQESYIRKIVSEVNGFDNIFFEVQNEPWADNPCLEGYVNQEDDRVYRNPWQKKVEVANGMSAEWQDWVASVISDEESGMAKSHLIARNISNFQYNVKLLPENVSMVNFHYALPPAAQMNLGLGGVVGLDETGFMPHEDSLYINQAWRFILSGGGLYNNLDYSFTAGNERGNWPIPESNPGWGGSGYRKKLSILVETMKQVPFHEMTFSGDILDPSQAGMKQYGLQKEDATYLVFLEHFSGARLVPRVPQAGYEVTYINVETGEKKSENLTLGRGTSLDVPFSGNQVALMIKKTE